MVIVKIIIETIPHSAQRYDTCGDWLFDEEGNLTIKVSDLDDWRYEALVGLHEAIEALLCRDRQINEEDVTNFDLEFESRRQEGNIDEPGDDANAPYRKEHFFATSIERLLAAELNVDWPSYDAAVNSL